MKIYIIDYPKNKTLLFKTEYSNLEKLIRAEIRLFPFLFIHFVLGNR